MDKILGTGIKERQDFSARPLFQVNTGKKAQGKENKNTNTVYMGGFHQGNDTISAKFALAQKNAIKKVLDQFKADLKIDDEMKERSNHIEELNHNVAEKMRDIKALDGRRSEIKERYGITPDSTEQKDLELIQKVNKMRNGEPGVTLTEEEAKRYSELPPVTDYQKEMLECDEAQKQYERNIQSYRSEAVVEQATIDATKKALLKVHPMADAKEEAKKIMEEAVKQQINGFLQQSVDKVNEDAKETQEKLEENKEKALEEKIQREKLKENEKEREKSENEMENTVFTNVMQNVTSVSQAMENVQANVKSLIQQQTLLDVDMKGLRVNQEI